MPSHPTGLELDQLLVLRGGIGLEQFWITWLTDYLDAHGFEARSARTSTTETAARTSTTETAPTEEEALR